MSGTTATGLRHRPLRQASLPSWSSAAVTVGAVLVTLLLFATTGFQGTADFLVVAVVLTVLAIAAASWIAWSFRISRSMRRWFCASSS